MHYKKKRSLSASPDVIISDATKLGSSVGSDPGIEDMGLI